MKKFTALILAGLLTVGLVSPAQATDNDEYSVSPAKFVVQYVGAGTTAVNVVMGQPRVASMGTNGLETVTTAGQAAGITKPFKVKRIVQTLKGSAQAFSVQHVDGVGIETLQASVTSTNGAAISYTADLIFYPGDTFRLPATHTATNLVLEVFGVEIN